MVSLIIKFLKNRRGALSIEFAGVFFLFLALVFCIYDFYSTLALQNKLERVTYSVASVFRERSALYPLIDETQNGLLCDQEPKSCYLSYEIFDQQQVQQAKDLTESLLAKEVEIKIDGLFILQSIDSPNDLQSARSFVISSSTCRDGDCDDRIDGYFNQQAPLTEQVYSEKIIPFVPRIIDESFTYSGINGRWIPLYRVSICIMNEKSFFSNWYGGDSIGQNIFPKLCHEVMVLSRCNQLDVVTEGCPIYVTD